MPHLLYAEDDSTLAFLTKDNLEQNGYTVSHCADGKSCLDLFMQKPFDLCILDIMLPGMDGFELAASIRKANADIPIIFLSAKTLKEDRIKGLKLGADDYLVKPFSIEELLLKIGIFLARPHKQEGLGQKSYRVGRYEFDVRNHTLSCEGERLSLTQREADLLRLFLDNKNKVLKREEILTMLWGSDDYFMGRSLDVFISRLRKVLADEKSVRIQNLHGVGFRYSDE